MTLMDLKKGVEETLRQLGQANHLSQGVSPDNPLIIFFYGKDDIAAYHTIASYLGNIWPQYRTDIYYISIKLTGSSYTLYQLTSEGKRILDDIRFDELVLRPFEQETLFANKASLNMPFICWSQDFEDIAAYKQYLHVMEKLKEQVQLSLADKTLRTPLFILGNESRTYRETFQAICQSLKDFSIEEHVADTVFLLSNHVQGGTILSGYQRHYQALAAILAITNYQGQHYYLHGKVVTSAYQRREKPFEEISQVLLSQLLIRMDQELWSDSFGDEAGVRGRFEKVLSSSLQGIKTPAIFETMLQALPRRDSGLLSDLSHKTASQLNDLTMGIFDAYLSNLAKETVADSSVFREQIEFTLNDKLIRKDWLSLESQLVQISHALESMEEPGATIKAQAYADGKYRQQVLLASKQFLSDLIVDKAKKIRDFKTIFQAYLDDLTILPTIRDQGLVDHYQRQFATFWSNQDYRKEFQSLYTDEQLSDFIIGVIGDLVKAIPVLSQSFEDELAVRWQQTQQQGGNLFQTIYNDFSQNNQIFFNPNSTLTKGDTIILINNQQHQASFAQYLHQHIKDAVYYDTANGNMAEVVTFYSLSDYHLA